MQLEVGTIVEGRVTGITNFGAFVSLPEGRSGLIHISEVANSYVSDIHEFLKEGQTVKVKVLSITPEGKINLSAKRAEEQTQHPSAPRRRTRPEREESAQPIMGGKVIPPQGEVYESSGDPSFEDKLKTFMQESNSRISGLKQFNAQMHRGTRRRR